jgi:hypothetical protein
MVGLYELYLALPPLTGVEEPYSGDTHFWFHSTQGDLLSGGLTRLAPVYDLVTTSVYLPKDSMALTLNGTTKWPSAKELRRLGETRMGATPARSHFCGTVPRTSWIRGLGKGTSSPPLIQMTKISEATRGRFRLSSHEPRERPVPSPRFVHFFPFTEPTEGHALAPCL